MTISSNPNRPETGKKWLAGSAAAVAGLAASNTTAETVQISLDQRLLSDGDGGLNPDLTGDGTVDLASFETHFNAGYLRPVGAGSSGFVASVRASFSGFSFLSAKYTTVYTTLSSRVVSKSHFVLAGFVTDGASNPITLDGLFPIRFSDSRINGGRETEGLLELSATSNGPVSNFIEFVRLVFDDSGTEEPADAAIGGTNTEFVPPPKIADSVVDKASIQRQIKALKRKIKRAKRSGYTTKVRRLKKKLRKLKQQLLAL